MTMRGSFTAPGTSIHYFVVVFDSAKLSWADFRGKVLGPTDPAEAPADSLRGVGYAKWKELGMSSAPNTGNNCVHASASPFEGFAERTNWLKDAYARPEAHPEAHPGLGPWAQSTEGGGAYQLAHGLGAPRYCATSHVFGPRVHRWARLA
jgi:hypothetical protein